MAYAQVPGMLHLCLWKDQPSAHLQDLGVTTQRAGYPSFAINNKGQIVCNDTSGGGISGKLVMLTESTPPRLIADKTTGTFALDDAGQVAYTGSDGLVHLWDDGADTVLPLPPSIDAKQPLAVLGLNNHGWLLAQGAIADPPYSTLVLWIDGDPHDLRDLVELPAAVGSLYPNGSGALNDVGQIVTMGREKADDGPTSIILLTPKK